MTMTKLLRKNLLGGVYYCVLEVTGGRIQAPIPMNEVPSKLAPEDLDAWLELHVDSLIPEGATPGEVSSMFVEVRDIERQLAINGEQIAKATSDLEDVRAIAKDELEGFKTAIDAARNEGEEVTAQLSALKVEHAQSAALLEKVAAERAAVAKDLTERKSELDAHEKALAAARAALAQQKAIDDGIAKALAKPQAEAKTP